MDDPYTAFMVGLKSWNGLSIRTQATARPDGYTGCMEDEL